MRDDVPVALGDESSTATHQTIETSLQDLLAADWEWFGVELFATVAEWHPELLDGPWGVLLALVKADKKLWIYPSLGERSYESSTAVEPVLDIARLHESWPRLKERTWHAM
jgi:hypothetical protein